MRPTAMRCWRCAAPSIPARSIGYSSGIGGADEKRKNHRMLLSASSVHGCRTARPSPTRPPRARPYPPSRWGSPPALGRSGPRVWRSPACSYGASRPRRATRLYRSACSNRPTRRWRPTKRWSALAGFPSDSSRPQASNALSSAHPATARRDGRPSPPSKGRGVNPSARTYGPAPPSRSRYLLLTVEAWARSLCQPCPHSAFLMSPPPRAAAQKAA
jgi:hypothetical protein